MRPAVRCRRGAGRLLSRSWGAPGRLEAISAPAASAGNDVAEGLHDTLDPLLSPRQARPTSPLKRKVGSGSRVWGSGSQHLAIQQRSCSGQLVAGSECCKPEQSDAACQMLCGVAALGAGSAGMADLHGCL